MRRELKLLDTVAILKDVPEMKVVFGQVGTIVEKLGEDVFEVEFADRLGETIAEFAIKGQDLMLLHYNMEFA
ncbi:MAG: DUF4926 domain-containing protein [Cyclobacteriaceae bacterium]|nr:DUF4926 domain-containing protein [Cyclobacteriaceae bacterium]